MPKSDGLVLVLFSLWFWITLNQCLVCVIHSDYNKSHSIILSNNQWISKINLFNIFLGQLYSFKFPAQRTFYKITFEHVMRLFQCTQYRVYLTRGTFSGTACYILAQTFADLQYFLMILYHLNLTKKLFFTSNQQK